MTQINFNNNYIINISDDIRPDSPTELTPFFASSLQFAKLSRRNERIISLSNLIFNSADIVGKIAGFVGDFRLSHVNHNFNCSNQFVRPLILSQKIKDPELSKFLKKQNLDTELTVDELFKMRRDLRKLIKLIDQEELENISEPLLPINVEIKKMIGLLITSRPKNPLNEKIDTSCLRFYFLLLMVCVVCLTTPPIFRVDGIVLPSLRELIPTAFIVCIIGCVWQMLRCCRQPFIEATRIERKYSLLTTSCAILQERALQKRIILPTPPDNLNKGFKSYYRQWFTQVQLIHNIAF